MNQTMSSPTVPAIPSGLIPVFVADLFERFAYYLLLATLLPYLVDSMGMAPDSYGFAYTALSWATMLLPVVGALIGDFSGHGKPMLIGAIVLASGYALLAIPFSPDLEVGVVVPVIGLMLIASGIGFYKASSVAVIMNLHNSGKYRFSALSSFMIYYTGVNIGAFLAPIVAGAITSDNGLGMDHQASSSLAFGACLLASVVSIVLVSISMGSMRTAGLEARRMASESAGPPSQNTTPFRKTAIPLVLVVSFFYMIPFGGFYQQIINFARRAVGDNSVDVGFLLGVNPVTIMVLMPVTAVIIAIFKGRGTRVNPLFIMGIGAGILALSLGVLAFASAGIGDAGNPLEWYDDHPSPIWLYLAMITMSAGEVLFGATVLYFVVRTARGRMAAVLLAAYFGIVGLGHQVAELAGRTMGFDMPPAAIFITFMVVAAVCAGLFFLLGVKMRHREVA